ncbi:hypothetical protein VNI00_013015 [Paramarasmius palmivorus]|uniref:Uncharacterized protein n=1 Tax=Paramarasmius palmivorus TaxID=297713 RepID=A0AAW0C3J8_9AGAR
MTLRHRPHQTEANGGHPRCNGDPYIMEFCAEAELLGHCREIHPIAASESFDFAATLQAADTAEPPPITIEQDLGPRPISNELFLELFGGDLSDYTDTSSDEEMPPSSFSDSMVSNDTTFATTSRKRFVLDCVEIPVPRSQRRPQSRKNARRREKRREKKASLGAKRRFNPSGPHLAGVLQSAKPLTVSFDAKNMAAAKGAHTGKMGKKEPKKVDSLSSLLKQGFTHVRWDGRSPRPIVDREGRIIAVLCGRPDSDGFRRAMDGVYNSIMAEGSSAPFGDQAGHRRGGFPAFNVGCTMGMGSSEPVALNNEDMSPVLARLLQHEGVQRLASYHNAAFSLWAPRLYAEYERIAEKMYQHNRSLPRNFADGVFTAATFNFGGNVWTYKHRDFFNWAFGWCFITALGRFDATRGGQLVMWELKLVVDFPHAATIALPSAVITHSNVPIRSGDERTSFTQYSAGPIFRWVENGFRTEKQLEAEDSAAYEKMKEDKPTAYLKRLPLYSTLQELTSSIPS